MASEYHLNPFLTPSSFNISNKEINLGQFTDPGALMSQLFRHKEGDIMKKLYHLLTGIFLVSFLVSPVHAAGGEMEILLKLLEKKGILTAAEAQDIVRETKTAASEAARVEKDGAVEKDTLPKGWEPPTWLKNTKFKGDFRLRGEIVDKAGSSGTRERERIRLRLGADTAINDKFSVGFGFGSGEFSGSYGNARSANQTMSESFTRKPVWVDYAYAKYQPVKWLSIIGGKFSNPLWQPSDFLFSNDINPEGAAVKFGLPVSKHVDLSLDGAYYVLAERSGDPDATVIVVQPGARFNFTRDTSLRITAAYYNYDNVTRFTSLTGSAGSNTLLNGLYRYEYNAYVFGGELGLKQPFGLNAIPYLGILGGYIHNPGPSDNNKSYLAGVTVGHPGVAKFGDWNAEYTFRRHEKDSILDILPDSSFYGGATNVMGHRVKLAFGVAKNTSIGLTYYNTWQVHPTRSASNKNGNPNTENVGQLDFLFKF